MCKQITNGTLQGGDNWHSNSAFRLSKPKPVHNSMTWVHVLPHLLRECNHSKKKYDPSLKKGGREDLRMQALERMN